jgi:hypothetical protein
LGAASTNIEYLAPAPADQPQYQEQPLPTYGNFRQ